MPRAYSNDLRNRVIDAVEVAGMSRRAAGPVNKESFLAYIEQVLVPTLHKGDIVIMDNLGSHKGIAVRKALRSVGAKSLFRIPSSVLLLMQLPRTTKSGKIS